MRMGDAMGWKVLARFGESVDITLLASSGCLQFWGDGAMEEAVVHLLQMECGRCAGLGDYLLIAVGSGSGGEIEFLQFVMENGPFGHAAGRWRDGDGWRAGRVCWLVMERGQGRAQARADGWIVAAGVAY
ncbi:hypothetical protein ACLOJK_029938 [Asimina triloba]